MTKNRTPTPVYLDPGMHPGLEVKGLTADPDYFHFFRFLLAHSISVFQQDKP